MGTLRHHRTLGAGARLGEEDARKLDEFQRLFELEASKYSEFPLDNRRANARTRTSLAGRPVIVRGRTHSLFAEMRRIEENADINTRNKSHSVIAEIELSASGAKGIDVAQGGGMSGWNAAMALDVDGEVGEGRIGRTHAPLFSTDERLEVSCDLGDPVYEDDEPRGNAFNGKVK